jgi:multidrug efflux pump subunit AcrA (membrane-fusion protein)
MATLEDSTSDETTAAPAGEAERQPVDLESEAEPGRSAERAGRPPAPRKSARRRLIWATAAVVAVGLVCAAFVVPAIVNSQRAPGSQYKTASATRTTLVVTASGDGNTMAVDSTDVYPVVSGTVERLYVKLGSRLKAGDRLYTIHNADLRGNVLSTRATLDTQKQNRRQATQGYEQAEQSLASANSTYLQATQNLDALRSKPATTPGTDDQIALAEKQVTAAAEGVDAAKASVRTAESGITAARANLSAAEYSYEQAVKQADSAVVYAPVDGVVTTMSLAEGQSVSGSAAGGSSKGDASSATGASSASGAGIVISDDRTLKVRVQISESDRPQVKLGQSARLTFDARSKLETTGTVSWIAPTGTDTQGVVTYDVDLTMAEQDAALQPGMTSTADIVTKSAEALVVPNAAIKVDGQTKYVTTLASDGTTKRVTVTTGSVSDGFTEVLTGLTQGTAVVTGTKTAAAGGGGLLPSMGN